MKYIGSSTNGLPLYVDKSTLSADKLQFRQARFDLLDAANKAGHYGCIVNKHDYQGNGVFAKHLYPADADALRYEERGEIKLDALYDKCRLSPADLPHITDGRVIRICNDKLQTSLVVGDLQPKSLEIRTVADLAQLSKLDNGSGKVAVKTLGGFGGDGVLIGDIQGVRRAASKLDFPLIAQEFIETDTGVPGLVKGRHDVRVLVLNGKPLGGSVRTPRPGGLLSNTHQGGSMRMLTLEDLPATLLEFAAQVDAKLPQYPRLYAADFMFSLALDEWFLIELNGSPGALPKSFGQVGERFQKGLLEALLEIA